MANRHVKSFKKNPRTKSFPNFMFLQKEGVSLSQSSPMEYTSDGICFAGSGNRRDTTLSQVQSYASTLRTQALVRRGLDTRTKYLGKLADSRRHGLHSRSMSPTAFVGNMLCDESQVISLDVQDCGLSGGPV